MHIPDHLAIFLGPPRQPLDGVTEMAKKEKTREEELRELLTDAIEVQLATLKAGIGFWSEWIEETSNFVQSASKTLTNINSEEEPKEVLLELVDAGRASARSMTELPRHTATRFIEALDEFKAKKKKAKPTAKKAARKPAAKKAAAPKRTRKAAPRRRAGRVKA